jgi:parvulin-like peptidyl-prolyl isomerase
MRRVIVSLIFIALLVMACAPSRESTIQGIPGVKLFYAMNDNVTYTEKAFSGDDAKSIADLVEAECPQGVGGTFVRVALDAKATTLILYTTTDGKNVTCSVLKPKEQKPIQTLAPSDAPGNGTALTVNGQPITIAQLQTAINALPTSTPRDNNTITLVVNQLINDELLRQAASKVMVSADDIAAARKAILAQANITEEQLPAQLQKNNATPEAFDKQVETQARLQNLLIQRLLINEINVTESDAQAYYMANPNAFLRTEQAVMRQVFISGENRTQQQLVARAQMVAELLNTTDFCEIVTRYSDDTQSKANCGVYIIPRGVIDPNLEMAGFTTPANSTAIVQTANGVHFVQTLQVTPAQVIPYGQVATGLQSDLRNSLFQQRLNLYVTTLRSDADIVSFLG